MIILINIHCWDGIERCRKHAGQHTEVQVRLVLRKQTNISQLGNVSTLKSHSILNFCAFKAVCPEGRESSLHSTAGVTVELKHSFKLKSICLTFFSALSLSLSRLLFAVRENLA